MEVKFLSIVCGVVLLATGVLVSASYAKIDPENIVGIWLFDEGSGKDPEDSSKNENHGTFTGDPEWTEGKFGGALEFNGDDVVIVSSSDSLKSTMEGLTVALWVYPTKICTAANVAEINFNQGWRLRVFHAGTNVKFFDRANTNMFIGGETPVEEWTHVAATGSEEEINVYVNGERVGGTDIPFAPDVGNDNLSIGAADNAPAEYFVGKIDDVIIFNVALSEDDINSIMKDGLRKAALGEGASVDSFDKLLTTWGKIRSQY